MSNNRWGLHWANIPIGEQLGKWALGMGGDCYLVMDGGHGRIPKIREARPNAIIVHRHAVHNWMDMEPEEWADQMAELYFDHDTEHIELECEPDIFPNFPGWGQPIIDRLKFAADWNIEVAERLIATVPGIIIHSPPLAHERIDLPQWFKIWKPVLDVCDVLDMHCYWEKGGKYYQPGLYDPEESYHRAFRHRKIHDFLTEQDYHIPMMVTECGNFAPNRADYADELIYYFSELEKDAHYMIGGCVFILKSNVHNWVNDLTRQPKVERFFRRLGEAPKKDLPYPNDSGGGSMGVWDNVPSQISQWKELIGKCTRERSVPIDDYEGKHISPAKAVAAIMMIESEGDPNVTNSESGAAGLMQIMPFHFEEGQPPHDPEWNIKKGLEILDRSLKAAANDGYGRHIQHGLFYYSGRASRPWEGFINRYWTHKDPPGFVENYRTFWGVDLEPGSNEPNYQSVLNKVGTIKQLAESIEDEVLEWKE